MASRRVGNRPLVNEAATNKYDRLFPLATTFLSPNIATFELVLSRGS
ncbi:hypothetical protein QUA77_11555 [Microcoleus sp. K5-D4]